MSPEELIEYLMKRPNAEEERVRQVLKTDMKLTDRQIEYLHGMLNSVDNGWVDLAKQFALSALGTGLTDECLIGEMYKGLSSLEERLSDA
jgi:hypothetical protein